MMDRYLEHETSGYSLHSDRLGNFLLVRRSDLAERYFQGDDARLWRSNIDVIVKIDQSPTGWSPNNSFDKSFDCLCSGYDDVLEAPE